MISTAMMIGMYGNTLAEETDSSRGRETTATEGVNEKDGGRMAEEGTGGMEVGAAGANGAGANRAGDSTTESTGTETGITGTSRPGSGTGREMGSEAGDSGADSVSGAQDGNSQGGSGGRAREGEDSNNPDDGTPGSGSLWVGEYEIFTPDGLEGTLDMLRKEHRAKVVVNVRSNGIRTSEVGEQGVVITELSDSSRGGGNSKVRTTSDKEDDLGFMVTSTRLTCTGKRDVLRLRVGFKSSGIPSEQLEMNISECEESTLRENGDAGSTIGQPIIGVKRISLQGPASPGNHSMLEVELENTSKDADIENMVVNVSPGSSLLIGGDTNTRVISHLDTGEAELVKFNLIAGQDISGPSQLIDLELKYNYYSGGQLISAAPVQKVSLPVKGGTATGQPVLLVNRESMGPVSSGQPSQITLRLENTDTVRGIRNLVATFEPNDQTSLLGAADTRQTGDIGPGQSVDVSMNLKVGSELSSAASQLLGITLKFDYDTDKGTVQGMHSRQIVTPTNGKTTTPGAPTPNIILTNYIYGDKTPAGQVLHLNMEFMNISQVSPIENVVISLETREGLSINSSSNIFCVPRTGPGEKKAQQVDVQALLQTKDPKVQSPRITTSCKYEYIDKTKRKQSIATETIAVPVYQPDRLQVGPSSLVEETRQNEETTTSPPYINKGRGQVYNVEANLEGDIQVIDRGLNLGSFDAGKSRTTDFIVTPREVGTFEGRVKVTHEGEPVEIRTMEIPVTFEVKERVAEETDSADMMGGEMDRGRKMNWKMMTGILTTTLVPGTLWIKRKKAKGLKDHSRCQEQNGWDELEDGQNLEGWDELEDSQGLEGWDELKDNRVLDGRNEPGDNRDQPSENEEDKT